MLQPVRFADALWAVTEAGIERLAVFERLSGGPSEGARTMPGGPSEGARTMPGGPSEGARTSGGPSEGARTSIAPPICVLVARQHCCAADLCPGRSAALLRRRSGPTDMSESVSAVSFGDGDMASPQLRVGTLGRQALAAASVK